MGGSGGIAPSIVVLGARLGRVVSFTSRPPYPYHLFTGWAAETVWTLCKREEPPTSPRIGPRLLGRSAGSLSRNTDWAFLTSLIYRQDFQPKMVWVFLHIPFPAHLMIVTCVLIVPSVYVHTPTACCLWLSFWYYALVSDSVTSWSLPNDIAYTFALTFRT